MQLKTIYKTVMVLEKPWLHFAAHEPHKNTSTNSQTYYLKNTYKYFVILALQSF